ncbi:MAG TPA: type II toxin-antitoxin system HicA family toxin [Candidatus Acetothermia bacterium]|nr:type II toxin-antitoxin system HicA family toxin [Candidatus Acetothermia bacterium]
MGDRITPVSWLELVKGLRKLGFDGPYRGGKHHFMVKGELIVAIPNPHRKEIGVDLLVRILRQAGISREDWLKARQ